jgi:hypothetical protein
MGFLDKLKSKGVGVISAAEPDEGVPPAPADEVRSRLLGISGKGIEAREDGDEIVVAWQAKVASSGIGAAGYRHSYRAISIELEPEKNTAKGICIKKDIAAGGVLGKLSGPGGSERGQPVGSETMHVVAWLGPHETEGAADEKGSSSAGVTFARRSSMPSPPPAGRTSQRRYRRANRPTPSRRQRLIRTRTDFRTRAVPVRSPADATATFAISR